MTEQGFRRLPCGGSQKTIIMSDANKAGASGAAASSKMPKHATAVPIAPSDCWAKMGGVAQCRTSSPLRLRTVRVDKQPAESQGHCTCSCEWRRRSPADSSAAPAAADGPRLPAQAEPNPWGKKERQRVGATKRKYEARAKYTSPRGGNVSTACCEGRWRSTFR